MNGLWKMLIDEWKETGIGGAILIGGFGILMAAVSGFAFGILSGGFSWMAAFVGGGLAMLYGFFHGPNPVMS